LDLKIKSVFLLPFSVMHPKFMIIDRKTVVLPSCNISWEEWFEGAITFSGPVVDQFLKFYGEFWERQSLPALPPVASDGVNGIHENADNRTNDLGHIHIATGFSSLRDITTIFLPSPHRRNPCLRPFTHCDNIVAPPTPLNTFILTLFAKAEKSIRIQTPNITSPPVLSALLKALSRGIDVRILTSERLMIPEQIVTAGTTTSRCVRKLIKRYKSLSRPTNGRPASDEEAAISTVQLGRLHVSFFEPLGGPKGRGQERGQPQQSHLKMIIADEEVLVLGSGNLDRASWFTSQELGVAFFEKALVEKVGGAVDQAMTGRSRVVFDSQMG
jgi:phosphatidylserine/phosphatidylglycerophosphate/cardiolipin synthase-like enzyme